MSKLRQAELFNEHGRELMLLGVRANGAVKGRLLVMTLEQSFRNPSDDNTEITYTFPLPWGAILMGVDVELNGKKLKGEVTARSAARAKYEEALSEGNSSIMLERNHDQSYTLELGNILAHEECTITVRYAQILQLEHGQLRLMLPTTIAPRYGNPLTQGRLQPHQTTVTDLSAEYPFDISITLYGDLSKANVASPSHKTGYIPGVDELVVRLAQRGSLDRDFILTVSNLASQSSAIACADTQCEGQASAMASFSPKFSGQLTNPLSVKMLVDCSGSMAGDSIKAARIALERIVQGLEKADKFSLSRFGSTVEHRSRGMWSGSSQAKASAGRWMEKLLADMSGTEMGEALVSTIAINHAGKSDILLVTDGEIEGIDEVIDIAKTSGHRVFIVAIGASPAEVHLRRLAQATGGVCDFVAPGEDVEPAVLRMFGRLRAARISGLRVEWPSDWKLKWSQKLPDQVFDNDAVNVAAFFDESEVEPTTAKLWGRLAGIKGESLISEASITRVQSTVNTLARMTAYAQYLEQSSVTARALKSKNMAQDLAVKYQLVTDETNFILVHERADGEKPSEMPTSHKVPQMLAAGWGGSGSVQSSAAPTAMDVVCYSMPPLNRAALSSAALSEKLSGRQLSKSQPDYHSMSTPSVWRTRDRASVNVLNSMDSGGSDDFEIPAFLRKDSDGGLRRSVVRREIDKSNPEFWLKSSSDSLSWSRDEGGKNKHPASGNESAYVGLTPAGFEAWLSINHVSFWPKKYSELERIGLGLSVCEWLEFEVGQGMSETEVVRAFVLVMREFNFDSVQGLKKIVKSVKAAVSTTRIGPIDEHIADLIRKGLKGIGGVRWPAGVVSFPEVGATAEA